MSEKSIIIIGAGLAGLSTGCYAQMNGYSSRIFEHHSAPGGVVAAWRRKDYLIDGGIHFLMGHKPGQPVYDLYRELGATEGSRFLDMMSYARYVDEITDRSVNVTPDLDRLAADLKSWSPADAPTIDDLIAGARAMRRSGMSGLDMAKPAEMMGFLDKVKQFWGMRGIMKYFGGKYAKPIAEYAQAVHDPGLRRVIENLFLPDVPVWFICMILGLLADGQMGLLEGGSWEFARLIEKRYENLGGEATYSATVGRILVEDDRAVGIRLTDGREHRADVIVSAADGYSTIFGMLEGRFASDEIRRRYDEWKLVRPFMLVSFGVAREFADEPPFGIRFLKEPISFGGEAITGISTRILNYSDKFAPRGKTVFQVMAETGWDRWTELRKDKALYDAEKERLAAEILTRLESIYPGITAQVEVTDVATPYTTWRYTLNRDGAYEGWLPTHETIMARPIRTLPGLSSFYMAGQWVMPGGGVPPCLYSGRHVIQLLCRADGRRFAHHMP
jgi:phytoene desaturase